MADNEERRYIGVRNRAPCRYGAEVNVRGSKRHLWLGRFDTALEAALAYDKATRRYNSPRANTNFPLAFEVPDQDEEEESMTVVRPPVGLELRLGRPGGACLIFLTNRKLGEHGPLADGLEYWKGFYQSLRPTQMGLSLNIDMSARAFDVTTEQSRHLMFLFKTHTFRSPLSRRQWRDHQLIWSWWIVKR